MSSSSQGDAAVNIQRVWRGSCARERVAAKLEEQILQEVNRSATKLQRTWRGHSSRERTMNRLEEIMAEEVDEAAERISDSLTKTARRGNVEDTPHAEDQSSDTIGSLSAYEFKNPNTSAIKDQLLDIRCQAGKIQATMDKIVPVLVNNSDEIQHSSRPFAELVKHDSLSSLNVAVVGFNELAAETIRCLCHAGVGSIQVFGCSDQDQAPLKQFESFINYSTTDPSDSASLIQATKESGIMVLFSDQITHRQAVEAASDSNGATWVVAEMQLENASFRFQYFRKGVIDVLVHDRIAAPIIQHSSSPEAIAEIAGLVQAVCAQACASFGGLVVHSMVKYWLGCEPVLGYVWYSATYNKFSTLALKDLRGSL